MVNHIFHSFAPKDRAWVESCSDTGTTNKGSKLKKKVELIVMLQPMLVHIWCH